MDPISSLCDTRELSQLKVQPKCMTPSAGFVEPKVLYHQHQTPTVDSSPTSSSVLENLHSWNHESLQYETERIINEPYYYLISHPEKDFRKQVLLACNAWLHVDIESIGIIERSIAMLHNAFLLDLLGHIIGSIDDIQDSSKLRRGSTVAHNIYGVAQTINSANYVYFQAQQHLMHLECWPRAIQIFNEKMLNLHRDQGMNLFWRDTSTVPTEEDYLQMISNKTGGLLRLLARLMMAMSKSNIDLVPFAEMLELIFQIQDDYKNLLSSEMSAAKGYCEDLTEGKFSFPIIHAIRNSALGNNEILHILRKRTEDTTIKDYAVTYMRDVTKSFEYTKTVLQGLHNQLKEMVEDIRPFNEIIQVVLAKLAVD